jgi:hypothetical protein
MHSSSFVIFKKKTPDEFIASGQHFLFNNKKMICKVKYLYKIILVKWLIDEKPALMTVLPAP